MTRELQFEDMVIGGRYIVSVESKHWWAGKEVILRDVHNQTKFMFNLDLPWNQQSYDRVVQLAELQESKNFKRPSRDVYDAIEKLRKEQFVYGYDGGPGGGSGETIDLTKPHNVIPMFSHEGQEGINVPVSRLRRFWSVMDVRALFAGGEVERSFRASEYTTIRTSLKLIEDKTKLPEPSRWSTMRD